MKSLYKEMEERLKYLESQTETEEIKWRKAEITLAIVKVQQLLLSNVIKSVCDCIHLKCKFRDGELCMTKTMDDFVSQMKRDYGYTEDDVRKAVDRLAFWVSHATDKEQFIVHRYLNFLSEKFSFEIDTNVDSR